MNNGKTKGEEETPWGIDLFSQHDSKSGN